MRTEFWKLFLISLVLIAVSCKKDPKTEPECKFKGKFEKAVCGTGLLENYWIRLEDGTFLQPCKSMVSLPSVNDIYEGMPVEVNYRAIAPQEMKCKALAACLAWPGEFTSVEITCLQTKGEKPADPKCEYQGTLKDMRGQLDGCEWFIDLPNGGRLEVMASQVDETKFKDGDVVMIGYNLANRASICMAGTPVDITCMTPVAGTTGH